MKMDTRKTVQQDKSTTEDDKECTIRTLGRENNYEPREESLLEITKRFLRDFKELEKKELNRDYYNQQFFCSKCKIPKPSARLLDIHIQEDHDNIFFQLLSQRQPMYECYVEACDLKFNNPTERHLHCISTHKYVKVFRSVAERSQFEAWEAVYLMNEHCLAQKRKAEEEKKSNKKKALDSESTNKHSEQQKSITLVPRQLLLEKFSKMNIANK